MTREMYEMDYQWDKSERWERSDKEDTSTGGLAKGLPPLCVKGFALLRCAAALRVTHSPRLARERRGPEKLAHTRDDGEARP